MIGSIRGKLIKRLDSSLLVEVTGVGYLIQVPSNVFEKVKIEEELYLLTHHYVREDAQTLYGFLEEPQLKLFELLLGVSGIGPKMALSIVSAHAVEEIMAAVSNARTDLFQSVSGIGKKNAQRIIVDLQSKIGILEELDFVGDLATQEVVDALVSLGYQAKDIRSVLKHIDKSLTEEEQLKKALKELGK